MEQVPSDRPGCGELDRATFQRVWGRVMPEGDRPDCPFTVPPQPPAPSCPMPPAVTPPAPPARPLPICLGEGSSADLPRLEELLRQVVDARRIYRALARRTGERLARELASAKDIHARRLRTAYFLIAGTNPSQPPTTPAPERSGLAAALRERFRAEQQLALACLTAAAHTADPCLMELYRELGKESQNHAGRIRSCLERR